MKCPECGAENSDHSVYCGRCAKQLREYSLQAQKDKAESPLPPVLERTAAMTMPKEMKIMAIAMICISTVLFLLGGRDEYLAGILIGIATLAIPAITRHLFKDAIEGNLQYLRTHLVQSTVRDMGAPYLTVSAIATNALAGLSILVGIGTGLFVVAIQSGPSLDSWVWFIPMLFSASIFGSIAWALYRNPFKLRLANDGIAQELPAFASTMTMTRDDVERIEIRGRRMRVQLKPIPFGVRKMTFILLCDRAKLGEVSQWAHSFAIVS